FIFFSSRLRPPPGPPLFPYTTLFRSPERRAYGAAGFVAGEKSAIVYDRFDLWQVNLDGSNPVRLTRGREDSTVYRCASAAGGGGDRKSTRLNSSHRTISYAVFCLKKK